MISILSVSSRFLSVLRKKRTNGSKQEARSPPAAVFDAAGSPRAPCLDAHARDSKWSPFLPQLPAVRTRANFDYQR